MKIIQNIAIGVGVGLIVAAIVGKKKIDDVKNLGKNLIINLNRINDIQLMNGKILINVNLLIKNKSNVDFSLNTGSLIQLKKIQVFLNNGKLLGEIDKIINNVVINPFGTSKLDNLDLLIETPNVFGLAQQLFSANAGDFKVKAHIEIFGNPYII